MNLTIKGLKTWATSDGGGYQCNLYKDGKKIAFVHNEGNGSEIQIDWISCESEINAYVESLPKVKCGEVEVDSTVGILIDDLVTEYEWQKKLAKHRKNGILFRFVTDSVDSFRTLKTLDVAKAVEYLDKNYPNKYVLI